MVLCKVGFQKVCAEGFVLKAAIFFVFNRALVREEVSRNKSLKHRAFGTGHNLCLSFWAACAILPKT